MEERWYDAGFARQWTNGPFLLNGATGQVVTEADLTAHGASNRYVVWDELKDQPAIYDPATGVYERGQVLPALFGTRILQGKDGKKIT